MVLFWNIILLLPLCSLCDVDYDYFLDPSSYSKNAEHYTDKEGNEYAFFSTKLSWHEASVLCSTRNGSLVTVEKGDIGTFLAQALSESALGYEALWVGAQFQDESWKWVNSEIEIPIPNKKETYPMERYPYWVEEPTLQKSKIQSCLALNRLDHDSFLLAPLPCDLTRPFICGIPQPEYVEVPKEIPPMIQGEHHTYILYQASLTWQEAVAFCLEKDYKLATLDFHAGPDSDFMLLSQRMLRSRPVIENAWINGRFDVHSYRWMWVADNVPISTIAPAALEEDDPSKNDPPWFRGARTIQQGCLLLDRHLTDHPVFVEAKCDRKRSFICQQSTNQSNEEFIKIDNGPSGVRLFISTIPRSWNKALERCKECFEDGSLLSLEGKLSNDGVLQQIADGMAHYDQEVRHIWLAGHLSERGDKWHWITGHGNRGMPSAVINKDSFKQLARKTNNIQVSVDCLTKTIQNMDVKAFQCLNMDRENQRHVFFYGLACNIPQQFFCSSDSEKYSCPDSDGGNRYSSKKSKYKRKYPLTEESAAIDNKFNHELNEYDEALSNSGESEVEESPLDYDDDDEGEENLLGTEYKGVNPDTKGSEYEESPLDYDDDDEDRENLVGSENQGVNPDSYGGEVEEAPVEDEEDDNVKEHLPATDDLSSDPEAVKLDENKIPVGKKGYEKNGTSPDSKQDDNPNKLRPLSELGNEEYGSAGDYKEEFVPNDDIFTMDDEEDDDAGLPEHSHKVLHTN